MHSGCAFLCRRGAMVMSFQRDRAILEGDLSAYMNQMAKVNSTVSDFALRKDASEWGVVEIGSQMAFYLLWPPWVRHRPARCAAAYLTCGWIHLCLG